MTSSIKKYESIQILHDESCNECAVIHRIVHGLNQLIDLDNGVTMDDAEELVEIACGQCLDSVVLEPASEQSEAFLHLASTF